LKHNIFLDTLAGRAVKKKPVLFWTKALRPANRPAALQLKEPPQNS